MIDLNKNIQVIENFLDSSIKRFQEENKRPNSIGIYCSPWSGCLTTNFNISKNIAETENNCPDFEYVEFDFLELSKWEDEYETDNPEYKLNGSIIQHDHDSGDESLNHLIFEYLKPIVLGIKKKHDFDFLLRMLDSNEAEVI